jgi:hypothetical protein
MTAAELQIVAFTAGMAVFGTVLILAPGVVLACDLPFAAQRVHICIRAEDVILSGHADIHSSARNRLSAVPCSVAEEGPLARIELDCGFRLKALLTRQFCVEWDCNRAVPPRPQSRRNSFVY